ncbi:MAG: hypothetical protein IMX02_07205 [Limnochordaceae bacterium]|nr:hypothetical protein [Limnochordaceae bacterium]
MANRTPMTVAGCSGMAMRRGTSDEKKRLEMAKATPKTTTSSCAPITAMMGSAIGCPATTIPMCSVRMRKKKPASAAPMPNSIKSARAPTTIGLRVPPTLLPMLAPALRCPAIVTRRAESHPGRARSMRRTTRSGILRVVASPAFTVPALDRSPMS